MILSLDPGPLATHYGDACRQLEAIRFSEALWERRPDVWSFLPDPGEIIAERLGWLGALEFMAPHLARLRAFGESVRRDGYTDVILLGMGGSSLAPEVIRAVIGSASGFPRFHMVDTVDPDAVRSAFQNISTTLFILASKSGTTIELTVLAAEAERRVRQTRGAWGPHVVAITDDGTPLHRRAVNEPFRDLFLNPADIGGRYSALTYFGLVPAALMGVDLESLLASARAMESECRKASPGENSSLALGALMAAGARAGRNKLTLVLPDRLQAFGLWAEQLVAESTGKAGKGVIPVVMDKGTGIHAGADSLVVAISLGAAPRDPTVIERVKRAGAPFVQLNLQGVNALGAEFLRWEVATVAAGRLLEINPFDEPNVQQAKDATRDLLDIYHQQKRLPVPEPHASIEGIRVTMSEAAERQVSGDPVGALPRLARPPDYIGLLAYLPPGDNGFAKVLMESRAAIAGKTGCATVAAYGPRYLHSTGQLFKGGPKTGVFVVLTAEADEDLSIPGQQFSFGVLEMAQALGDVKSLDKEGRRTIHCHLPKRDPALLTRLVKRLLEES